MGLSISKFKFFEKIQKILEIHCKSNGKMNAAKSKGEQKEVKNIDDT
jgi:hypothetical protein